MIEFLAVVAVCLVFLGAAFLLLGWLGKRSWWPKDEGP